jgi:hypothetical protein
MRAAVFQDTGFIVDVVCILPDTLSVSNKIRTSLICRSHRTSWHSQALKILTPASDGSSGPYLAEQSAHYNPLHWGGNMKTITVAALVFGLVASSVILIHADASGSCTIDQRIHLGKQGYTSDRVDKMCGDAESPAQASSGVWDEFLKSFMGELGKGISKELLNDNDNNAASAAPYSHSNNPTMCITGYGQCPLQGVPAGAPCYCRAYNGFTAQGIAR